MQSSRAPAISVSAESCIPAGLRLGPVPGIFKLGKYLSDRREPGPKKKVFSYRLSAPLDLAFSLTRGKPAREKRLLFPPLSPRSSLLRASQEREGKRFQSVPRCLLAALPGKPARPCPLPLLPSAGAPLARPGDPGALPEERTRPRLGHRRAASAAAARCPPPGARCPVPEGASPAARPPPRGAPLTRALPPFPGRARTCHGWLLAPAAPARRGHAAFAAPPVLSGEGGGPEADAPIYFCLRLGFVPPRPSPRPRIRWLGPEGSAGRAGRGSPGGGGGVRVAGVGAAQRSSASSPSLGPAPTPGAAN